MSELSLLLFYFIFLFNVVYISKSN